MSTPLDLINRNKLAILLVYALALLMVNERPSNIVLSLPPSVAALAS
jgi:hypothetical protein